MNQNDEAARLARAKATRDMIEARDKRLHDAESEHIERLPGETDVAYVERRAREIRRKKKKADEPFQQ